MSIKAVFENDIDLFFNEIERITYLYVKPGFADDLSEKWIRAAILKHLFENISTALAIDLKKAATTEEMQSIINSYLHDHRTGLPRGALGPMLGF